MTVALEFKPAFAQTVERMRRFWDLQAPGDRIPAIVSLPSPKGRSLDGTFFGNQPAYLAYQEKLLAFRAQVADDWVPIVTPQYGHALIGALCGAPIEVAASTVWVHPMVGDVAAAPDLRLNWDNAWGRKYREDCEALLTWARGRCAVACYEIEGIADTLSALRGAQDMIFDFLDNPAAAHRLAAQVAEVLVAFGRWQGEQIGARQQLLGGQAADWGIWMPAGSMSFAEDATVLYSPDIYRQSLRCFDEQLTSAFTRTLLEVHAEGCHQLVHFGGVPNLSCMVIGNPLKMKAEHREVVRQLLGRKRFYISVKSAEIEAVLQFTGTRGILLGTGAPTPADARRILDDLERLTAKYSRESVE